MPAAWGRHRIFLTDYRDKMIGLSNTTVHILQSVLCINC